MVKEKEYAELRCAGYRPHVILKKHEGIHIAVDFCGAFLPVAVCLEDDTSLLVKCPVCSNHGTNVWWNVVVSDGLVYMTKMDVVGKIRMIKPTKVVE